MDAVNNYTGTQIETILYWQKSNTGHIIYKPYTAK